MDFVILTHPIEIKRRRIATGRMAHLSLNRSFLFMGVTFQHDARVERLLRDVNRHCILLYPSRHSANLTEMSEVARGCIAPPDRRLTIFVVDGTWNTARKTVNQSANLNQLPRYAFLPPKPSAFKVRQQPRAECLSTIEAIHHTVELLSPEARADRRHDQLLSVFSQMVEKQWLLANSGKPSRKTKVFLNSV